MHALIAGMGQVPIVLKKFISGYIANRIQWAIRSRSSSSSTRATPAREINNAIVHGFPCASRSSAASPRPPPV